MSEQQRAEDLPQRAGAEQVLGAVLAHPAEVLEQAVEGEPVLGRGAGGASDAPQQLGALFGVLHLCGSHEKEQRGFGGDLSAPLTPLPSLASNPD